MIFMFKATECAYALMLKALPTDCIFYLFESLFGNFVLYKKSFCTYLLYFAEFSHTGAISIIFVYTTASTVAGVRNT